MRRPENVIWREVDGKIVGLDLRSSRYFSLNSTGAALWRLLEDDPDLEQLADALVEAHAVDRRQALVDARTFVDALQEHGLVE